MRDQIRLQSYLSLHCLTERLLKHLSRRQKQTSFVDLLCFCSVLCLLCFVRVCLYVLRGHLLGKGWPLGSRLWCLLWVCHFPIGILGQVWYLIVSIPDLCNLTYFVVVGALRVHSVILVKSAISNEKLVWCSIFEVSLIFVSGGGLNECINKCILWEIIEVIKLAVKNSCLPIRCTRISGLCVWSGRGDRLRKEAISV